MKFDVRKSFVRDSQKLPPDIQYEVSAIISEIEQAKMLAEIKNCKKMKGTKTAFRIKMKQYRIGFFFENETVELIRILSRKDIYKYFP